CLDENHPAGKHKAVKFNDALLFTKKDTTLLKKIILDGVKEFEALPSFDDEYGKRYYVDMILYKFGKKIPLRTSWIIKQNEDFPRLTTCYIKKR
ncbi:MAG: DUF6883 domain-containing protein, partial [Chitinophagales bacterium]